MNDEFCLYHVTEAKNLPSIKEHGLLTKRDVEVKLGIKVETHSGLKDDPRAVYLGKKDGLNYPLVLMGRKLAMLMVCFDDDDIDNFYPDEDYIRDEYGEDDVRFEEEHAEEWEFAISEGYGAKHKGSISQDHVKGCELGYMEDGKFKVTGSCNEVFA